MEASTTEPEVFDYEGKHVVVLTDSPVAPCAGTMAHMDDFVERLSERLGVPAPSGDERIRFTWARSVDEVTRLCGLSELVRGCAKGDVVYSQSMPLNHELVHAVGFRAGYPPPFFTEGLAVAHAGYGGVPIPEHYYTAGSEDTLDLIELSSTELGNVKDGYERAGRFTAYLIDRHGLDTYVQLYAALPREAGIPEIDQVFQETLGLTLAQSVAGFGPPWTDQGANFDPQLSECSAREVSWDGQLLTMEGTLFCTDANAVGPFDGETVESHHTIDIPADGIYELRIVGNDEEASDFPDLPGIDYNPPFIGVSIISCDASAQGYMETQINGKPRIGLLKAGRHSLRLHASNTLWWVFDFTLKRLPDP